MNIRERKGEEEEEWRRGREENEKEARTFGAMSLDETLKQPS